MNDSKDNDSSQKESNKVKHYDPENASITWKGVEVKVKEVDALKKLTYELSKL
jgi:uncharacterized protein YegL